MYTNKEVKGLRRLNSWMLRVAFRLAYGFKFWVWACTLKALALTPLVLRWLLLALKYISLAGSIGSLTSLFSARFSSSRRVSLEKAPSSISEIWFPVKSILFRVTVDRRRAQWEQRYISPSLKSEGFKSSTVEMPHLRFAQSVTVWFFDFHDVEKSVSQSLVGTI